MTPLLAALHEGETGAARLLVEAEADANAADDEGTTPLTLARGGRCGETARMLEGSGEGAGRRPVHALSAPRDGPRMTRREP